MLVSGPFLRAILFSWRRFLTLLLCRVHQPPVPWPHGIRTPSGQTGTVFAVAPSSSLLSGAPWVHGPMGSARAASKPLPPAGTGEGPRLTVARRALDPPASCLTPYFSIAASLLQDMLAGSRPQNCLLSTGRAGEFTQPSPRRRLPELPGATRQSQAVTAATC